MQGALRVLWSNQPRSSSQGTIQLQSGSHRSWDSCGLPSMKLKALIPAVLAQPLGTLQYQHR